MCRPWSRRSNPSFQPRRSQPASQNRRSKPSEPEATAPEAAEPVTDVQPRQLPISRELHREPAQRRTGAGESDRDRHRCVSSGGPTRMGNSARSRPNLRTRSASLRPISSGGGFQDVANAFGLDPAGEIAGLLGRRDTWSGRSVYWPVAGTDLKMPVDLAALPVYDRNRNFEGFRGFGVARAGDALRSRGYRAGAGQAAGGERTGRVEQQEEDTGADRTPRLDGVEEPAPKPEGRAARGDGCSRRSAADPFRGESRRYQSSLRRTAVSPTR